MVQDVLAYNNDINRGERAERAKFYERSREIKKKYIPMRSDEMGQEVDIVDLYQD